MERKGREEMDTSDEKKSRRGGKRRCYETSKKGRSAARGRENSKSRSVHKEAESLRNSEWGRGHRGSSKYFLIMPKGVFFGLRKGCSSVEDEVRSEPLGQGGRRIRREKRQGATSSTGVALCSLVGVSG